MLPAGLTEEALARAEAEADPDSLAAAGRLRRTYGPELASAALHQASLRRRARTKFGDEAGRMFFTRTGLEQATRPEIAAYHARRLQAAGARRVFDLGCGIGSDARACAAAGLTVIAVDLDPATAAIARANLGPGSTVVCADAETLRLDALAPDDAVFCDPARRTERGRLWRLADFTPSWGWVRARLDGRRPVGVKLGPALPHTVIPAGVEAQWVTHGHDVVEVTLWAGPGAVPERRSAFLWPDHELVTDPRAPALEVRPPGRYVFEPDGSVIRSGGLAQVGAALGAALLDPDIAYLTADQLTSTPWATAFAVQEVLPYDVKVVKEHLRARGVGRLEIKKRGIDVDPADLRRRLDLRGLDEATLILSRTPRGALALITQRS
jgi:SAM-dependent methyltransferase